MKTWILVLSLLFVCGFNSSANAQAVSKNTLNDFTSDGCSMSPDGVIVGQTQFVHCCVEHDVAYWQGGTRLEKLAADLELKKCVRENSNALVAEIYFRGVRIGGLESLPTKFHWGYGWAKRRNYSPLTEAEQDLVAEKLSKVNWTEIYSTLGVGVDPAR